MRLKIGAAVLLLASCEYTQETGLEGLENGSLEPSREAITTGGGSRDTFFTFSGAVDYGNTRCVVSSVIENQVGLSTSTSPSASATFDATGNPDACIALCGAWDRTFTQWPSTYDWMHRQVRITSDIYARLTTNVS